MVDHVSEEAVYEASYSFTSVAYSGVKRRQIAEHGFYEGVGFVKPILKQVVKDYEEVLADHKRLVRELDVLLNGQQNAAKQASLCDIVAQVQREKIRSKHYEGGEF